MAPARRSNSNRRAPRAQDAPQQDEQVVQDTPLQVQSVAVVTQNDGITQKVKVYAMEMKGQVMQIVGSVGDRIVIIKTKSFEFGTEAKDRVRQSVATIRTTSTDYVEKACNTVKAKTVFLQNGYVYMATKVEGQVVYVKAKVIEPVKSCALSFYTSSKKRADPLIQKLMPYYTRTQNGITNVIGAVNGRIVVIRTKISDGCARAQVLTLESLAGARSAIQGYTSPLLDKAVALRQNVHSKVDHIFVTIKDGIVSMKCRIGERVLQLQTKISEITSPIFQRVTKGLQGAKDAISELTTKLVQMLTSARNRAFSSLKLIQTTIVDKYLYVKCQVGDRLVVFRLKVDQLVKYMQFRSVELYGASRHFVFDSRARIVDVCNGARTRVVNATESARIRVVNATEITKAKALETGSNIRSFTANPDARAGAAGAVALGASGGVTGLFAGAAVGAACALPAAFFTFGLSIPVGAAVGASAGGAVGSSAGFVAGGVAGYKAHKEKEAIGKSISGAFAKAKARKEQAMDSASNLRSHLAERINGHTGGTATD